jgi:hypothetical protein
LYQIRLVRVKKKMLAFAALSRASASGDHLGLGQANARAHSDFCLTKATFAVSKPRPCLFSDLSEKKPEKF